MRLRNITGSREAIAESPYVIPEAELTQCPGTWAERFEKKQPLFIEIGTIPLASRASEMPRMSGSFLFDVKP